MDLKEVRNKKKNKLKKRVQLCRKILIEEGVKKALEEFIAMFPTYEENYNRTRNLFYCNIFDDAFTQDLEAFTETKKPKTP